MITSAHARKSGVIFVIFYKLSNKKSWEATTKNGENSLNGDAALKPFGCFYSKTRVAVGGGSHRPPMTNVGAENAFRHDHSKHFQKQETSLGVGD